MKSAASLSIACARFLAELEGEKRLASVVASLRLAGIAPAPHPLPTGSFSSHFGSPMLNFARFTGDSD